MKQSKLPVLLIVLMFVASGILFAQPPAEVIEDSVAVDTTAETAEVIEEESTATSTPSEEETDTLLTEETPEEVTSSGIFSQFADFFRKGGFAMWPILIFLACGLAIIVERVIFLYSVANIKPERFMGKVADLIRKGSIEGAIASCSENHAPLSRIIEAALRNYRNTERDIQNAVDEMALAELPRLNARVGYLAMLANVCTMVGLLGTIFGLIEAFKSVAAADAAEKTVMLANGISKAMSTTAFGLIAAIPLLLAHSVLTSKADALIDDIDRFSVMVINMLAQARKEG